MASAARRTTSATRSPITILQLAERVISRADSRSTITFVPYEEAYDEGFEELGRRRPDTTALEAVFGWRPTRTLDQALDDVIAYQRTELAIEASVKEPLQTI